MHCCIQCSHFIIEDERKKQHFGILCFIISRKVEMQLKKKKCSLYAEGAVTDLIETLYVSK